MRNACLLLLLSLLTAVSCGNKKEKMLCKRWQVSDVIFVNEKETLVQSDTLQGNMQQVTKTVIADVLKKNIYEFRDDGTYLTGNAAANAEGKWKLEGGAIRFISKKGEQTTEKVIPVESLTPDTLVMVLKNDQSSMNMKLILTPLGAQE